MPLVIVGHRACPPLLDRQPGLRAVERLDLTLLIDREDQRVGRRVEEAHDIVKLLREVWVVAELEVRTKCGLSPWRFQIRRTLAGLMHSSAARVRVLQCVAVGGRSRVVLRMTSASTAPCWTSSGAPGPARPSRFRPSAARQTAAARAPRSSPGFPGPPRWRVQPAVGGSQHDPGAPYARGAAAPRPLQEDLPFFIGQREGSGHA